MPKTALVINPWVTDFKLYDEWMHPIGLYFLISLLKFNGWDLHYINCLERDKNGKSKRHSTGDFPSKVINRPKVYKDIFRRYKQYGISEDLFTKKLHSISKPDIIFIGSSMTYWIKGLVNTVNKTKDIFPDVPIIIGGTSATLIPKILRRKLPDVDIFPGPYQKTLKNSLTKRKYLTKSPTINGSQPLLMHFN